MLDGLHFLQKSETQEPMVWDSILGRFQPRQTNDQVQKSIHANGKALTDKVLHTGLYCSQTQVHNDCEEKRQLEQDKEAALAEHHENQHKIESVNNIGNIGINFHGSAFNK